MNVRRRIMIGLGLIPVALFVAWSIQRVFRPRPSLAEAAAHAEARRFDHATALVSAILRDDPSRSDAHMLAAQIALDRPGPPTAPYARLDPKPAIDALEHLKQVRANDLYLSALIALTRGRAEYRLGRLDQAEKSWLEALRLQSNIPEAGWLLLETYYLQGRTDDARRLALRLHEVEPDPRDRVQFLLELLRQDAQPRAPASIVLWFEPVVEQNPGDLHANLALGQALIQSSQVDRGLEVLRLAVRSHPDRAAAWDAWLIGLDDAGQIDTLTDVVERLPNSLVKMPLFAKHRARVAQERQDWTVAAFNYRQAIEAAPHDHRLEYRLSRVLRNAGEDTEAARLELSHRSATTATPEIRSLYERANADQTLGLRPDPALYRQIGVLRDRMGLSEEAHAWLRLASQGDPATDTRAAIRGGRREH